MRKSPQARDLERRLGKPIKEIVAEAYTKYGTIEAAAASLDVKTSTFAGWMVRLGIRIQKKAVVA